jgi:hypothetical protein
MTTYTVTIPEQKRTDELLCEVFNINHTHVEWVEFQAFKYRGNSVGIPPANAGVSPSAETRELIRQALLGRKFTDEWKAKIGAKHKGKIVSDETKQKLSESRKALKGKYSEEHKQKLRDAMKRRGPMTPEQTAKMLATRAVNRAAKLAAKVSTD